MKTQKLNLTNLLIIGALFLIAGYLVYHVHAYGFHYTIDMSK